MNQLENLDSIAHLVAMFLHTEDGLWDVLLHTPEQSQKLRMLHSFQDRNHKLCLPQKPHEKKLLSCITETERPWVIDSIERIRVAPPLWVSIIAHPEPYLFSRAAKGDAVAEHAFTDLLQHDDLRPAYQLNHVWSVLIPLLKLLLKPMLRSKLKPRLNSLLRADSTTGIWVHPQAVVHASSHGGIGVQVEQGASVAANVRLDGATILEQHCLPPSLLGRETTVGENVRLHAIVETGARINPGIAIGPGSNLILEHHSNVHKSITSYCNLPCIPAYHHAFQAFPPLNEGGFHSRVLVKPLASQQIS